MVDIDNLKGVDLEWNTNRWGNIYFYKKPGIVGDSERILEKNHVKKSSGKELEKGKTLEEKDLALNCGTQHCSLLKELLRANNFLTVIFFHFSFLFDLFLLLDYF